jgi:hypothetical protein
MIDIWLFAKVEKESSGLLCDVQKGCEMKNRQRKEMNRRRRLVLCLVWARVLRV